MNIYSYIIIIITNKNTFVNLYIRKIRLCFIKLYVARVYYFLALPCH